MSDFIDGSSKLENLFASASFSKTPRTCYWPPFNETASIAQIAKLTDLPHLEEIYRSKSLKTNIVFERANTQGLAIKIAFHNFFDDRLLQDGGAPPEHGVELELYCDIPGQDKPYNLLRLIFVEQEGGLLSLQGADMQVAAGGLKFEIVGNKNERACLYNYDQIVSLEDHLKIFGQRDSWLRTIIPEPAYIETPQKILG